MQPGPGGEKSRHLTTPRVHQALHPDAPGESFALGGLLPGSFPAEKTIEPAQNEAPASVRQDVILLLRAVLAGPERLTFMPVAVGILAVLLVNLGGQIWLNDWNRGFGDALEKRDLDAFLDHLVLFCAIIAVLLSAVVGQTFLRERLKISLRAALVAHLKDRWLRFPLTYQMGFHGPIGENPDQRIQEDTRNLADLTAELGIGALQAVLLLLTFIGVLWSLSSAILLPIGGKMQSFPGYMVWCALIYAGIGTYLTFKVGRPLIGLHARRAAREADFRFALVRVSENAESIGVYRGEADERRRLDTSFGHVRLAMRDLSSSLARLTWITSGYGWLALVVPIVVAAPGYFAGALTFGFLMQVTDAFSQVQGSLRWFVDQFPRLADWRAALHRVADFERALHAMEARSLGSRESGIHVERKSGGRLYGKRLSVCLPDGTPILAEADFSFQTGDRILISGASGIGKSTLIRVLTGLWPWGGGVIGLPETMMVMPQRPYLPLGSLRNALTYPAEGRAFSADAVSDALRRVGLGERVLMLDETLRWDKVLSIGEQQRLAFARLLLHRPPWVLMDEATAALDDASQAQMFALFESELAGTSFLNIAHRTGLERFHTSRLVLSAGPDGALAVQLPL
jgi:vitamin B12/bleomycin/antimicrobial peptide transport system ATP-binding/permease protein